MKRRYRVGSAFRVWCELCQLFYLDLTALVDEAAMHGSVFCSYLFRYGTWNCNRSLSLRSERSGVSEVAREADPVQG